MEMIETWRAVFIIVGAPGFLLAFLTLLIPNARTPSDMTGESSLNAGWQGLTSVVRTRWRVLVPYFIGVGPLVGLGAVVAQWSPAFFTRKFDLPISEIGLWIGITNGLLAPFITIFTGIMLDRIYASGVRTGPFWFAIVMGVLCGPIYVATFLQSNASAALVWLSVGLLVNAINAAVNGACIHLIAPPEVRGRITAIGMLMSVGFGQGIAVLLVPLFSDFVLKNESDIGIAIAVVAAGLCVFIIAAFGAGVYPLKRLLEVPALARPNA